MRVKKLSGCYARAETLLKTITFYLCSDMLLRKHAREIK